MIAQEVEKVLPEIVGTNSDGYKSLDYPKLTDALVGDIKEFIKENGKMRREVELIKNLLRNANAMTDNLNNHIDGLPPAEHRTEAGRKPTVNCSDTKKIPSVSVIIPCRNEAEFIASCLDSVISNRYPHDRMEILVIDGLSNDGTRNVLKEYSRKWPFITLLDNPRKSTPYALNIGIRKAKGEIILRMDAHSIYDTYYIAKCVGYLYEYGADNVGGVWKIIPRGGSITDKAVAEILGCPFGTGNAHYRFAAGRPRWADTVPYFCCRKEIFADIGFFNELLTRGQDMEFNIRIIRRGGKILLAPDIVSRYRARSGIKTFIKHNFTNGIWAVYAMKFTDYLPVKPRHLVPFVFVSGLVGTAAASFLFGASLLFFLIPLFLYSICNLYFSAKIAINEREIRYLFILPFLFAALHISYGLGSLAGIVKYLMPRKK